MKVKWFFVISILNALILLCAFYWMYTKVPKVAYVKVQEVYSQFELKKELEKKMFNVTNARKSILDSMEIKLKSMNLSFKNIHGKDKLEESKLRFQNLSQEYYLKKKNFTEDNQRVSEDYESQILKQLNEYIYNYGKEHSLDIIYGANGNGSLMYGSEKFDITEPVTKYVNEHYAGKQK
jgi:outer membrane protein